MMGTYFIEVHVSLDGVCFCFGQKPTRRAWSLTSVFQNVSKIYIVFCLVCFVLFSFLDHCSILRGVLESMHAVRFHQMNLQTGWQFFCC